MNAKTSLAPVAPQERSRDHQAPEIAMASVITIHNRRSRGPRTLLPGLALFALLLASGSRLLAGALMDESFENYNLGALDANIDGGPNSSTNGGPGNPWWGPYAPNLQVVDQELGIFPHSGTNMVRGRNAGAADTDFINLAYRFNGGNVFTDNILCDWWFYDPVGAGPDASLFSDYLALGNYPGLPATNDYSDSINSVFLLAQPVLALGGTEHEGGAFDPTVYQAQAFGATNGYDPTDALNNWFNTTTPRSVGWHHGRILVSPVNTNAQFTVNFFIDDLINPTLTKTAPAGDGFNAIQLLADNGSTGDKSAYYDDLLFYTDPPAFANPQITKIGTNLVVTFPDRWILQTSTNLAGSSFVDVTNAVSPYTNSADADPQFFRLRY
jgi:hypothetical protein